MWREVTKKRTNEEWVKSRLEWEDWRTFYPEAVELAKRELRRRRWRGAQGGVVPRGYDAESIASETIARMLAGESRIAPGWTPERLMKELERMITRKVNLLWSLKEAQAIRSEWEIAPPNVNGEPVSALSDVAGDGQNGYEAAVEAEEGEEGLRRRVAAELGSDRELKEVLGCLWEGETRTREIARRLGMTERSVVLARRRLARKLKRVAGAQCGNRGP